MEVQAKSCFNFPFLRGIRIAGFLNMKLPDFIILSGTPKHLQAVHL